jgi:hypothetical protein
VQTGTGLVGWRRLMPACASCAGHRPSLGFREFAGLLGGPAMDGVDREALVPLLSAEVALLQARLDEVQEQLARLTGRNGRERG